MVIQATKSTQRRASAQALVTIAALLLVCCAACATVPPSDESGYPERALGTHRFASPVDVPSNEARVAEEPVALIEAGLQALNPDRPQGRDYSSAAAFFLRGAEVADPVHEQDLALAAYRAAARSSLRAGDRETYERAVQGWLSVSMQHEQQSGELAVHRAILARLHGETADLDVRVPAHINNLITTE